MMRARPRVTSIAGMNATMQTAEHLGPVDVLVVGYPADAPMTGDAIPILLDLVDRGVIRVLDALFVVKEADGTFSGFEARDLEARGVGDLVAFEGASSGLLGDADAATAAESLDPGSAAVLVVLENSWAAPLFEAVHRNGGLVLGTQRIEAQDLMVALEAAEARV
jgi:Family of unknown function (DUF6325)